MESLFFFTAVMRSLVIKENVLDAISERAFSRAPVHEIKRRPMHSV